MNPTQVRKLVDCPACGVVRGERCRRSRWHQRHGWTRIANHQERIDEAMKTRYVFDAESGLLVSRHGEVLGRVVSITIEDAPCVGRGISSSSRANGSTTSEAKGSLTPSPESKSDLEREALLRIWNEYVRLVPSNRRLDSKRRRVILNALRVTQSVHECDLSEAEALIKRALLGLSRSPHHNGQNEQHKTYLEIRYALKGIGHESDDERIEKAISWAAIYAPERNGVDDAKIERWIDDVRYHLGKLAIDPGSQAGRERAKEAYHRLVQAGFKVERLDHRPYARVTR